MLPELLSRFCIGFFSAAKTGAVFRFQLGMLFSDHTSEALSRKAKRLDSSERRGKLFHAQLKLFFDPDTSQLSVLFISLVFPLDIEGLLFSIGCFSSFYTLSDGCIRSICG
jgi:hypothetical protein